MNKKFRAAAMNVVTLFVSAVLMAGHAWAGLVTVDGTFTSFRSWIFDPSVRVSLLNNLPLASSGAVVGNNGAIDFFMSNTIILPAPTTSMNFTYDPASLGFIPLANSLGFTPAAPTQVESGDTFQLGTFSFTNGQWYPEAEIGFRLTTRSTDVLLDGHTFNGTLRVISTAPSERPFVPEKQADYFFVVERPDLGSARVFELISQPPGNPGNTGEFAFNGMIGSLIPTGIVALNNGGFTNPSIQPALLPVPEIETYTMMLAGLAMLALIVPRRRVGPQRHSAGLAGGRTAHTR